MSLVGPRPERPPFVAHLKEQIRFYDLRLRSNRHLRAGRKSVIHTDRRWKTHSANCSTTFTTSEPLAGSRCVILMETVRVVVFGEGAQ